MAGQSIQQGQGGGPHGHARPGSMPPVDMPGSPMVVGGGPGYMPPHHGHHHGHGHGPGPGAGPRRRHQPPLPPHAQYHHQYPQHMNMNMNMYANYVPPYGPPQQYYGMPPQYAGMPSPGYVPNYQNYPRSPTGMHHHGQHQQHYVPMTGVSVPPNNYARPAQQQSPALATPYQPPPAPAPASLHSHTPSSTHSAQMPPPQSPHVPMTAEFTPQAPVQERTPVLETKVAPVPEAPKEPFRPPVSFRFFLCR